jgi:hypothetical protein
MPLASGISTGIALYRRSGNLAMVDFMFWRVLLTAFGALYFADGLLSVLDEVFPSAHLNGPRNQVAWIALWASLAVYLLLPWFGRLPYWILLPPTLYLLWISFVGVFPLDLCLEGGFWAAWMQLVLGTLCLIQVYWFSGWQAPSPVWLVPNPNAAAPPFRWVRLLGFAALNIALLPIALACAIAGSITAFVNLGTEGYARISWDGVYLQERHFVREADGKEIRLIGMMHIADGQFFDATWQSIRSGAGRNPIVLLEGVTDRRAPVSRAQGKKSGYSNIARLLGLSDQSASPLGLAVTSAMDGDTVVDGIPLRRADVDISDFSPLTLDWVDKMRDFMQTQSWPELTRFLIEDFLTEEKSEVIEAVWYDIHDHRNGVLIAAMNDALTTHDCIMIPWGALHMPAFQEEIAKSGFFLTSSHRRPAIRFWTSP